MSTAAGSFTSDLEQDARGELQTAISGAVVSACLDAFGQRLRAIVLTGSAARHEATFVWSVGKWSVLGDAEFFLVFDERCPLPPSEGVESVRQQAERILRAQGISCYIDLSAVHPIYFIGLQPHILAYELKQCGQVLWGDRQLLGLIPPFSASDIVLEDAWRLLSNRMVEYLAVAVDLSKTDAPLSSAVFYRTVKLYLDMATSFLVFAGRYEPTYAARAARLHELLLAPPPGITPPFPLFDFADRVEFCTRFKLQQPGDRDMHDAAFTGEEAVIFWRDAVEYAHRLWRWELCQLTRSAEWLSDGELMREWMRRQSMIRRLRGWVRVFRDSGWRRSWEGWSRWLLLARQGSPRHCVYVAAAVIFFRLPVLIGLPDAGEQDGFDLVSVCRWLPLPALSSSAESGPLWARAASAVFSNYQRFVAVTRA